MATDHLAGADAQEGLSNVSAALVMVERGKDEAILNSLLAGQILSFTPLLVATIGLC